MLLAVLFLAVITFSVAVLLATVVFHLALALMGTAIGWERVDRVTAFLNRRIV